jgi:hypothetical protein
MKKDYNIYYDVFKILIILSIFGHISNLIYYYITKFERTITVDEKYAYSSKRRGQTISDTNNVVYVLRDVLVLFHWTSVDLFNELDVGKTYKIQGYGIRVPYLGWFPNIISAKLIE